MDWKAYAISLGIGVLVGVIYALLNTRSPAPPIIALLGLLGMLVGEGVTGWAKAKLAPTSATSDVSRGQALIENVAAKDAS